MASDNDIQPDEQVSRNAQGLLAEYFRIRREYNSLDRNNPAHAPRRAVLKEQYFALDRKYTDLIRAQQTLGRPASSARGRTRADVLWEGAFANEESRGEDLNPGDVAWVEMNTPAEGGAADEVFEEALRSLDAGGEPMMEMVDEASAPAPLIPIDDEEALKPAADETDPERVTEMEMPAPGEADSLGDLDRPNMSAVSALREIAAGLQQEEPITPSAEASALDTPLESIAPRGRSGKAKAQAEKPHVSHARGDFKSRKRSAKGRDREVACPSCGESLPAGTPECGYCHARLIEGEGADADTTRHIALTNLQPPKTREKAGIGPKLIITLGWLIVLIGSMWIILRSGGVGKVEVDAWLEQAQLSFLIRNQAATILGVSLVLLGTTIVGAGVFAGRFVRLVVPMHDLARSGRVDTIEKLILQGEDIDPRDERGCTPLHFAVVARQREVVAVLVGNGADPNAHNDRGDTPLHLAAANRDQALAQYLLGKGADASALNDSGSSLMHVAAWVGDVGLLKICLDQGLSIDARTKAGFTPLHFAAQSGYDDAVAYLLEQGADGDAASRLGTTPLFAAVRNGHLPVVKRLADAGADLNLRRGHDLQTPLGLAGTHKRIEIAEFLRGRGAKDL